MKTNRKLDNQLYNLFKDVYADEQLINETVRDAKKAFSYIKNHDAVYRDGFTKDEP